MIGKNLSDKGYDHVLKVWDRFEKNITTICTFNVSLLPDVFEENTNSSLKSCGLCLNHYLNAPCLSWDAMLSMKAIAVEIISDTDMYLLSRKRYARQCFLHFYNV